MALLWLAFVFGLCGLLAADALVLGWGQKAVEALHGRWSSRVDHGTALLAEGKAREAADWLEALAEDFPARTARHGLDREMERLLLHLARAYERCDRPRRAAETYARLARFDPRNWRNHHEQATALIREGRGGEAIAPLQAALAIKPWDLAAAHDLVSEHAEAGRWQDAVAAWERYVGALVFADVQITWSGGRRVVRVPVDGAWHGLDVALPGAPSAVEVCSDGWAFALADARVVEQGTGREHPALAQRLRAPAAPRRGPAAGSHATRGPDRARLPGAARRAAADAPATAQAGADRNGRSGRAGAAQPGRRAALADPPRPYPRLREARTMRRRRGLVERVAHLRLRAALLVSLPFLVIALITYGSAFSSALRARQWDDWWSGRKGVREFAGYQVRGCSVPCAPSQLENRLDPRSGDPAILRLDVRRHVWDAIPDDPQAWFGVDIPARLVHQGRLRPVELRVRGDTSVHWTTEKVSFTLKTPRRDLFRGLRRMAFTGKEVLNQFVAARLAAKLDLLRPRRTSVRSS